MSFMNLILAFAALDAGSSRQRARCAKTGRFVAWSKAAPLRRAVAGQVVFVPQAPAEAPQVPATVAVIDEAPVGGDSPVATTTAAVVDGARRLVAAAGRWFSRAARLAGAAALAATLAAGAGCIDATPVQGRSTLVDGPRSAAGGAP